MTSMTRSRTTPTTQSATLLTATGMGLRALAPASGDGAVVMAPNPTEVPHLGPLTGPASEGAPQ